MNIFKKKIAELEKCYSIAPLHWKDKDYFLVAAEKSAPCYLFDLNGDRVDTVWTGPGGVMSMVQIPGSDGAFLATQRFYSPNDSAEAKIVMAAPGTNGQWSVSVLLKLPYVHRFDILSSGGKNYLIACTLKSGHEYKDDWRSPGKVYVASLPDDPGEYKKTPIKLEVLMDGLFKNHGYYRITGQEQESCLISSEQGICQIFPPREPGGLWRTEFLTDTPASDAVLVDLDNDGDQELCTLAPFHGDEISIYKKNTEGKYQKFFAYPQRTEFLHAIYGGVICGQNVFITGHRKGAADLLMFYMDSHGEVQKSVIDHNCGSANVFKYTNNGLDILVSANRENDEIALYTFDNKPNLF